MRVPKKLPTWVPELLDFAVQQSETSDRSVQAAKVAKKLIKTHYEAFAAEHAPAPKSPSATKKRKKKAATEAVPSEEPLNPVEQFATAMESLVTQPEVLQTCLNDLAVPFLTSEVTRLEEVLHQQQEALEQLSEACSNQPAYQQLQETCRCAQQVCEELQRKTHQKSTVEE